MISMSLCPFVCLSGFHSLHVHEFLCDVLAVDFRPVHRPRSSFNFRGHDIFARKICMKNYQNTRIFIIFARKINKIP